MHILNFLWNICAKFNIRLIMVKAYTTKLNWDRIEPRLLKLYDFINNIFKCCIWQNIKLMSCIYPFIYTRIKIAVYKTRAFAVKSTELSVDSTAVKSTNFTAKQLVLYISLKLNLFTHCLRVPSRKGPGAALPD